MRADTNITDDSCARQKRQVTHFMHSPGPLRSARSGAWRVLLLGAILPLAGCGVDRTIVKAEIPHEYTARHPIIIGEASQGVEIFASGAVLDRASLDHVEAVAQLSREAGRGGIEILFPQGSANDAQQRAALPAIRKALAAGGASGNASVGVYPVADPAKLAPIRLSYRTLRASVATKCGDWPTDLMSGSSTESWQNRPYWNMGCAYQTMMATQVSDPRDLVQPRATGNGDVEMRIRAIGKVRQGTDPGTTWVTKNSSIGSVGGN